jgi:uncharacterized paraquat-inducible protein A
MEGANHFFISGDRMNGIGSLLRQLGARISISLRRFMEGRYGNDKLNNAILGAAMVLVVFALFIRNPLANLIAHGIAYALMFWAIFRTLSRNTYKRYQENRKFLQVFGRLKDREHRYFDCPKCRQMVRVPRGKGKIAITCPRCKEKFVRKS